MILPVLAVLLVFAAISAWSTWSGRRKLLARIRDEWGRPRDVPADMESVAAFFRSRPPAQSLDDRTWKDLLLDDVFAFADRTQSSIGQQMLYCRLRLAQPLASLNAFDVLMMRVAADTPLRERAQMALAKLRHPSGHQLHHLAGSDVLARKAWHVVFPLWAATIISVLLLAIVWHALVFFAVFAVVLNTVIRLMIRGRVGTEIIWSRQLGPLLSAAAALAVFDDGSAAAITGSLKQDLAALQRVGAIARWVSRDPLETGDLLAAVLEFLNGLFLMDANALYFASSELRRHSEQVLNLIGAVGEIDAAIAVASLREDIDGWIKPTFTADDSRAMLSELRHPLVDAAVPNSVALAPPHGLLVTGSNMSGKSTFLRTVGVNVVLAQTINTCLARSYEAPVYQVRSCIGRADDLIAGKSYYLVEVESVLALVKASERPEPQLFIFDELFRGTNAVERIAAAEAVLAALIAGGRPHVVLAATHDGELVDLLRDSYAVCHLGDAIGPEGLTFDYHLKSGPATSRNAIALLKLNGAPESLVTRALERAAALDRQRQSVT